MLVNSEDINKFASEKALKRLAELAKPDGELVFYTDGSIYRKGKLLAEEPIDDQKEWVLFRLSHSNTWPKVHENKIGDPKNWK